MKTEQIQKKGFSHSHYIFLKQPKKQNLLFISQEITQNFVRFIFFLNKKTNIPLLVALT